ncbi:hypothetical protein EON64_00530 [archaeon]|nr:MAG: hypothetical protein EON64_00530 [archaeon]
MKEETTQHQSVAATIFADLLNVQRSYTKELSSFFNKKSFKTDHEKNKRILYLFQRDLLPGICGQILESKEHRDNVTVKGVSKTAKMFAWVFLAILNLSMLFYIFLFAVSQDSHRQAAWAKSFGLWLVAEIILVSTFIVVFMHVIIPSFIMKDVKQIKSKLVESLVKYHNDLANNRQRNVSSTELSISNNNEDFNSAEYLFVSYKLASQLPHLKTAEIIAHYETVWPRQSYQHISDVSKNYNRRFTALTQSASMVLMFFITNLLSVPLTIQDMIMQMVTTAMTGYTILIHLQLFQIFPVLVIIPAMFLGVVLHFIFQSHRKAQQENLQAMLKTQQAKKHGKAQSGGDKEEKEEKKAQDGRGKVYKCSDDESYSSESDIDSTSSEEGGSLHKGVLDLSVSSTDNKEGEDSDSSLSDGEIYVHQLADSYGRSLPKLSPQTLSGSQPGARHRDRRQSLQLGLDIVLHAQRNLAQDVGAIAELEEESGSTCSSNSDEQAHTVSAISLNSHRDYPYYEEPYMQDEWQQSDYYEQYPQPTGNADYHQQQTGYDDYHQLDVDGYAQDTGYYEDGMLLDHISVLTDHENGQGMDYSTGSTEEMDAYGNVPRLQSVEQMSSAPDIVGSDYCYLFQHQQRLQVYAASGANEASDVGSSQEDIIYELNDHIEAQQLQQQSTVGYEHQHVHVLYPEVAHDGTQDGMAGSFYDPVTLVGVYDNMDVDEQSQDYGDSQSQFGVDVHDDEVQQLDAGYYTAPDTYQHLHSEQLEDQYAGQDQSAQYVHDSADSCGIDDCNDSSSDDEDMREMYPDTRSHKFM